MPLEPSYDQVFSGKILLRCKTMYTALGKLWDNFPKKRPIKMTRLNPHGPRYVQSFCNFFASRQIGVAHVTWWLARHSKEVFGPQVQRLIQSLGAFQRSSSRLNHNVKVILGLVWVTNQSISRCWDWEKQDQIGLDRSAIWQLDQSSKVWSGLV